MTGGGKCNLVVYVYVNWESRQDLLWLVSVEYHNREQVQDYDDDWYAACRLGHKKSSFGACQVANDDHLLSRLKDPC